MKRFLDIHETIEADARAKRLQSARVPTRLEMSSMVQDDLQRGHAIFDSIRSHFEDLDGILPRSSEQIEVHDGMLAAASGIVYGEAINTHEAEILSYNNFKNTLNNLLLSAPRRLGKTFAIAMAIAVFFLCVPNVKFVIVSQARRSAGADVGILGTVKKLLWDVFGFKEFDRSNSEQILSKFGEGDERRISSYSGGSGDAYGTFVLFCFTGGGGWPTTAFYFSSFFFFVIFSSTTNSGQEWPHDGPQQKKPSSENCVTRMGLWTGRQLHVLWVSQ